MNERQVQRSPRAKKACKWGYSIVSLVISVVSRNTKEMMIFLVLRISVGSLKIWNV